MKEITTRRLSSSALQEQLEEICKNLIYISETDSPVRPFMDSKIESITSNSVARALGRVSTEPVERVDIQVFFEKLTRSREWHRATQKTTAELFGRLEKLLTENLEDASVFRFGTIRIDIFVVGKDARGNLSGVKTKAVET